MTALAPPATTDLVPRSARSAPRWLIAVAVLGSYLFLSLDISWPFLPHVFGWHDPAPDAQISTWGMAWLPHALTHFQNPFFTRVVGWPDGVNILDNTTQIGLAFFEWPITALFGPDASYNIALLLCPALCGGSTYLVARRFTTRRSIAWIAGLAFGFSAGEIAGLASSHLNLIFVPALPLMLLVILECLGEQRPAPVVLGSAFGALAIFQFFVSTEMLIDAVGLFGLSGVVLAIRRRRDLAGHWHYVTHTAVWAAGISVVALAVPTWYALAGPGHVHGLEILTPQAYRADLTGVIAPDVLFHFAPKHVSTIANQFANSPAENFSYLGIPLVFTVIVGAIALRRRTSITMLTVLIGVSFLASLGGALAIAGAPGIGTDGTIAAGTWLPWHIVESLPVVRNIIPSRLAMFTNLGAALMLAAVLETIVERTQLRSRSLGITGVVAVAVLCLVPLIPRLPLMNPTVVPNSIPAGVTDVTERYVAPGAPIVTYPYPSYADLEPIRWQTNLGFRFAMPTGYFRVPQGPSGAVAFSPGIGYAFSSIPAQVLIGLQMGTAPPLTPELRSSFLATLHRWNVSWLIANIYDANWPKERAYLRGLLGKPVHREGTILLYAVPR